MQDKGNKKEKNKRKKEDLKSINYIYMFLQIYLIYFFII